MDTPVTYHANGMWSQIEHSNGMRVQQAIDTSTMMQRPKSINVFDAAGTALSYSGDYAFDGAGNIKAMIVPMPAFLS